MDVMKLAKSAPIAGGAATVYMLPFVTARSEQIRVELRELLGDTLTDFDAVLCAFEPYLAGLTVHQNGNEHVAGLELYWQERNPNDWAATIELWRQCISVDMASELFAAYQETRSELPTPPAPLSRPAPDPSADPKVLTGTGRRSRRKSSRS